MGFALECPLWGFAHPQFASPANAPHLLIRAVKTSPTFSRYVPYFQNFLKKVYYFYWNKSIIVI
jgi:hypothetical protein